VENQDNDLGIESLAGKTGKRAGRGAGIAWLALLLAVAAAAYEGWQWWQDRSSGEAAAERADAVRQLQDDQLALGRQLGELRSRQDELRAAGADLAGLEANLEGLRARLDQANSEGGRERQKTRELEQGAAELADRVGALEGSLAALAARGESPGKRVELAEIDFLLRNATERLQLFEDRRGAMQALALADVQLASLDDPLYLPVRQAIASARLELVDMPVVDRIPLTQRLAHLQSGITGLPFPGEAGVVGGAGTSERAIPQDAGLWERFKAALAGLVTVRRRVDEQSLISIEDKEYVRQGLWLQLESARLALLRLDQEAYDASLRRAEATLRQYFDAGAAPVMAALEALAELGEARLHVQPPDISTPWTLLNALRGDLSGTAPMPAESPEAGE